jgi:hypothetical protein
VDSGLHRPGGPVQDKYILLFNVSPVIVLFTLSDGGGRTSLDGDTNANTDGRSGTPLMAWYTGMTLEKL